VGLFRRRQETLNEQLLREGGLDPAQVLGEAQPPPPPPGPTPSVLATLGVPDGSRVPPKEWDATVAVAVPGLAGNRIEFTTLPNGDVIVDVEQGDADLSPLAEAVEKHLTPPYRARGHREDDALWGVAARRIDVRHLPKLKGDVVDLIVRNGQPDFFGLDPEGEFAVHAERLDGDFWEVQVGVL
jgi:hypothetical protein